MLAWCMLWSCVCLSVTSQCATKMAKFRITQTTSYVYSEILVFSTKGHGEILMDSPPTGAPATGGLGYRDF